MSQENKIKFAFFGSSDLSILVLEKMKSLGHTPSLIIAPEDKPKGRKLVLTPPESKTWADQNSIPCLQLRTLRTEEAFGKISSFGNFDVFIVASYGKLIPDNILNFPKHQTLNVHPSLLPKLRGASPIISAILSENETGVSIIRLDSEMDHGPILSQEKVTIDPWPPYEEDLEKVLAERGAEMLCDILPDWISGKISELPQDHSQATLCGKFKKEDGELNLSDDPNTNLRKIRAFHRWPGTFYFDEGKRIIVKKAKVENGKLIIERVVPEGKKEMNYEDYLRGKKN